MHLGDAGGAGVLQAARAALFPVFDQVGAQLTGPADAAFHEAEIEARVAPHQTAQENALGEGVMFLLLPESPFDVQYTWNSVYEKHSFRRRIAFVAVEHEPLRASRFLQR
jgi:hypothetical protein